MGAVTKVSAAAGLGSRSIFERSGDALGRAAADPTSAVVSRSIMLTPIAAE